MSLGTPLGLMALLGLVPLVAAYFLRRRQKPLQVSALFLWRTPDIRAQAGPRWQRPSRELSLLLESLAVICLALFLADPQCGPTARERHLVLVVDGSLSMSARSSSGPSVVEKARAAAAREVERARATVVTVVQSGPTPRLLAGPKERASTALSALEQWHPRGPTASMDPALSFARELAGTGGVVSVITDGAAPAALPAAVSWIAVGAPMDNVAFVAAQRNDSADGHASISLRVQSFARERRDVTITFRAEPPPGAKGSPVERQEPVTLAPGEVKAVSWEADHAGLIHAELPEDALPDDGQLTLPAVHERTLRIQLSAALDDSSRAALERGLQAVDDVLLVTAGGDLTIGPEPDSQVVLAAPAPQRSFVGPFFSRSDAPLLEDVSLSGVVWTAGSGGLEDVLLSAGEARLLSEDARGRVRLNLDLARSNIARTPAWPVLLANLIRHARAQWPGFARSTLMLGQEVQLVVPPGSASTRILGPELDRPVLGTGALLLPPFDRPGAYRLLRDGKELDTAEVLPLAPAESDLRDRTSAEKTRTVQGADGSPLASRRTPWPLVLMLALVALDFAVTGRGG